MIAIASASKNDYHIIVNCFLALAPAEEENGFCRPLLFVWLFYTLFIINIKKASYRDFYFSRYSALSVYFQFFILIF